MVVAPGTSRLVRAIGVAARRLFPKSDTEKYGAGVPHGAVVGNGAGNGSSATAPQRMKVRRETISSRSSSGGQIPAPTTRLD